MPAAAGDQGVRPRPGLRGVRTQSPQHVPMGWSCRPNRPGGQLLESAQAGAPPPPGGSHATDRMSPHGPIAVLSLSFPILLVFCPGSPMGHGPGAHPHQPHPARVWSSGAFGWQPPATSHQPPPRQVGSRLRWGNAWLPGSDSVIRLEWGTGEVLSGLDKILLPLQHFSRSWKRPPQGWRTPWGSAGGLEMPSFPDSQRRSSLPHGFSLLHSAALGTVSWGRVGIEVGEWGIRLGPWLSSHRGHLSNPGTHLTRQPSQGPHKVPPLCEVKREGLGPPNLEEGGAVAGGPVRRSIRPNALTQTTPSENARKLEKILFL